MKATTTVREAAQKVQELLFSRQRVEGLLQTPELEQALEAWTTARNRVSRELYANVAKRVFFLGDPETVHDGMTRVGALLGGHEVTRALTRAAFHYQHDSLKQTLRGVTFDNPVGLSAGFDKDAHLTEILPEVGFGFAELGSITGEPCDGNPKPRLWRLKNSQSIVVYYGLKNDGCEAIAERLRAMQFRFPIGISIAKTNSPDTVGTEEGIADYLKAYRVLSDLGDYDTINISCPNAFGGEPFTDPERLDALLEALNNERNHKPMLLKLSPDLEGNLLEELVSVAEKYGVDGYVCTNLTKDRTNPKIFDETPEVGGLSGKVVEELATEMVRRVYTQTRGKKLVVGCGGVSTAEGAYRKIRAGASLIQLITGMIFEGPQIISEINQGLVRLLERDGLHSVSEAVGLDNPVSATPAATDRLAS